MGIKQEYLVNFWLYGKRGKKVSFSVMCRLSNTLNIPIDVLKDLELNY